VRRTALNLLARREHSVVELQHKLLRRGFALEQTTEVLAQLVAEDLLDNARYAEAYAHARVDKGYGPRRIDRELRERGVSESTVLATLAEFEDVWMKKLREAHRKRFGATLPSTLAEEARQARFLRQRGFTSEQIGCFFRSS
jgi:regulatory protein